MKVKLFPAKDYIFIVLGLSIYAFAWNAFLIPSKIIGGGVAGIATLLSFTTHLPAGLWIFLLNSVLIILGWKTVGKKFAVNSVFGIIVTSILFTILQPLFPKPIVQDEFMCALIGGGLAGFGLGIAFSHNGNSGGLDIISLIVSHYRNISPGKVSFYGNLIIIASSYLVFHSISKIVYGYVIMGMTSYTLDMILAGERQSLQIFIISRKSEQIANLIANQVHRGITMWHGKGWYTGYPFNIIMVIARKHEITPILRIIKQTDESAFVSISRVQAVFGTNFDKIKLS
jgi:uncharacterized membrane-anchored protein YitT (DUF2179 family)